MLTTSLHLFVMFAGIALVGTALVWIADLLANRFGSARGDPEDE